MFKIIIKKIFYSILLSLILYIKASNAYWLISKSDIHHEINNKRDILLIFSMKKSHWSNGEPIRIVVLPSNNKLHQDFVKNYMGINYNILDNIWNMNVHSGNKQPPIVVNTKEEMIEFIKSNPGTIGYVYSNHIPGINTINIDDSY